MNDYCLMTFKSVTFAMQFEKLMKSHNIEFKLIPVPRSISANCGMCGKFSIDKKEFILKLCNDNGITYEQVYDYND